MTNHLASLTQRDYFYLDAFWRVNLGMYIISGVYLINRYMLPDSFGGFHLSLGYHFCPCWHFVPVVILR